MAVASCGFVCFVLCFFCTGHFVMVPLDKTLSTLFATFFLEHLFNLNSHPAKYNDDRIESVIDPTLLLGYSTVVLNLCQVVA